MSLKAKIESSEAFLSLSFIQKMMVMKYQSQLSIEHALTVIENIGEEKWLAQTNLSYTAKKIVIELKNQKDA